MSKIKLGVNIDHIATVRQARGIDYPDPLEGAEISEANGADGITIHLREDRRHIVEADLFGLKGRITTRLNLEMALAEDIISIAKKAKPDQITLVPEKREELTTEGGLDVIRHFPKLKKIIGEFHDLGVLVSLFVEPEKKIIESSKELGADYIEIHTGTYCNLFSSSKEPEELSKIYQAASLAKDLGLGVNAGHGLNLENIKPILKTPGLEELNIGHSIISRAIFVGLGVAVREMVEIIKGRG